MNNENNENRQQKSEHLIAPHLECLGCRSRDQIIKTLAAEIDRMRAAEKETAREIREAA